MANSAPNGHGATIATLETKVSALELSQARIERTLGDLDSAFNSSITNLQNDFRNQLGTLTSKIEQGRTPLVAIISTAIAGFGFTTVLLGSIGALVYGPIQRDTTRLDNAVSAIIERSVPAKAYDEDQKRMTENLRSLRSEFATRVTVQRYTADQERTNHALDEIRNRFASKAEMEAVFKERQRQIDLDSGQIENMRNRTYDHFGRIAKAEQSIADMERRFDAVSRRLAEYIRDNGRPARSN